MEGDCSTVENPKTLKKNSSRENNYRWSSSQSRRLKIYNLCFIQSKDLDSLFGLLVLEYIRCWLKIWLWWMMLICIFSIWKFSLDLIPDYQMIAGTMSDCLHSPIWCKETLNDTKKNKWKAFFPSQEDNLCSKLNIVYFLHHEGKQY